MRRIWKFIHNKEFLQTGSILTEFWLWNTTEVIIAGLSYDEITSEQFSVKYSLQTVTGQQTVDIIACIDTVITRFMYT